MYHVIWVVAFLATGGENVTRIAVQANTGQSPNVVAMSGQRRRRWDKIEWIACFCWGAAAKYTEDSVRVVAVFVFDSSVWKQHH